MAVAYLLSGAPSVVSCLWTVTDKDIDKYTVKVVSEWMEKGERLYTNNRVWAT